jgi:5'-methylthioadenosine phosphorylase
MLGILGGTSLFQSEIFAGFEKRETHTPYGDVIYYRSRDEPRFIYLQRHHAEALRGAGAYTPPHRIRHRANVYALQEIGVDRCVGVYSVGSLNPSLPVGTCVVTSDFCALPQLVRAETFYEEDQRGHRVIQFDQSLRKQVLDALQQLVIESATPTDPADAPAPAASAGSETAAVPLYLYDGGVYVQTVGPRFETPAEVRMLRTLGDVVGMTGASEAVCCGELGIAYMQICMVDNMANGLLSEAAQLEISQFHDNVRFNLKRVERMIQRVIETLRR